MTQREHRAWIAIRDNGEFAGEIVSGLTLEAFSDDRKAFYAATRCLEIVSEASRRLRGAQQGDHAEIEWRRIEDSGNVFRHDYDGVEEQRIWSVIVNKLPELVTLAKRVLEENPHQPEDA